MNVNTRSALNLSLARLAPLFACAGVLTTSLPAAAQEQPAPPPEAPPEAPPAPAEASPSAAASTPEVEPLPEDPPEVLEEGELAEVVVTGFRVSLGAALLRKQRTTGQVDAIVADDIADFPDLNLAESLQRLPGVSITRNYGEGAQITVRGLNGLYTRVRVNGMESRAAIGNNTGRNFDFSLFASELFNSIVVNKTAAADLDEGSLGAVVDLNTARAFNYDEGFTFVAGATGVYNDLSQTVRPRLTGLVAYRDPAGVWGATASAAYTKIRNDSASRDTVRWQKGPFRSVNGVPCSADITMETDPGCAEVTDAFHPRIPRYGQEVNTADRIGLTAGIQFRPTDQTELRLDGLYASFDTNNDRRWLELLFRGNEGRMDISDYLIEQNPVRFGVTNNTLVAATVDNAFLRSERNPINSRSDFYQLTLALDHRFSDSFYVDALGGTTRSKGVHNDHTVDYDIQDYNGYSFDYRDDKYPSLVYGGLDVNDPANYQVTELRDGWNRTTSSFDTAELNLHYDIFDELKLAGGVNYKVATLDTHASGRSGTVCALGYFLCDADGDMVNEAQGPPGEAALTDFIEIQGRVGPGSNTRFASPNPDAWFERFGYRDLPLIDAQPGIWKVTEKNLGYYLQTKGEILLGVGDMRLLYDAGVRYVQTRQTSSGYNTGVYVEIDRPMYDDWLPSANTALWLTDQIVVRLAAAEVMARPALNQLSPGGTVSGVDYTVGNQNPLLDPTRATALDAAAEWYFAENSILALALFHKDIDSFPIGQSRIGTFASTGLPRNVIPPTSVADQSPNGEGTCGNPQGCWQISELTNGPGADLKGLEVAFQVPFSEIYGRLPPVINALGILANYTFVDSSVNYDFAGTTVEERLVGLSNHSVNATLYYDDSTFGARLSVAYRSDYLLGGPAITGNLWDYAEDETRLDFSSSYNVNEHLKLSLEAVNLLNTPVNTKTDIDAERRVLYNNTGRNFLLGARVSF
jgi:iron complex outermembrane receptor protein